MVRTRKDKPDATDVAEKDILFQIGLLGLPFFCALIVYVLMKGDSATSIGPACAIHKITGFYCPGCGATRAFYCMAHLHFVKSVMCNPFILYSTVVYIVFMIITAIRKIFGIYIWKKMPIFTMIYVSAAIIILQCIIRNVLYFVWNITCL